jgi:hypothetical protein
MFYSTTIAFRRFFFVHHTVPRLEKNCQKKPDAARA